MNDLDQSNYKYVVYYKSLSIAIDVKTIIMGHVLFKPNFVCGVWGRNKILNFLNNKYDQLLTFYVKIANSKAFSNYIHKQFLLSMW